MPVFKLPLSGDVAQTINPWTLFFNPAGQFGLINISLGQSSAPEVEQEVLSDVGTYGKQLVRIGDVLAVLLKHFHPAEPLTADETQAIDALNEMLPDRFIKQKHHQPAMSPGGSSSGAQAASRRRHRSAIRCPSAGKHRMASAAGRKCHRT